MDLKKKITNFWYYNKWTVCICVIVLFFAVMSIRSFIYENRECSVYIDLINCKDEYAIDEYLTKCSEELLESGIITSPLRLEGGFIHPESSESAATDSMVTASIQRYQADVVSKRVEVTIASDWVIRTYSSADAYIDLRTILSDEQLEKYGNKLYFCKNSDGNDIAAGIYLDAGLFNEAYNSQPPVYAISVNINDYKAALAFLEKSLEAD